MKNKWIFPAIAAVAFLASIIAHKELLFRDYSFFWEGAYRLSIGQKPFVDFGLPLGAVSFWIPAVFFKIFGPSYETLRWSGIFVMAYSVGIFHFLLRALGIQGPALMLGSIVFLLYHGLSLQFPWYNTYGLAMAMTTLLVLAKTKSDEKMPWAWGILAGVFAGLTFLTKQDYGALTIVFGIGMIALRPYLYQRQVWNPKYAAQLGAFIATTAAVFFIYKIQAGEGFSYWFNLGQPPHDSRMHRFRLGLFPMLWQTIRPGLFLTVALSVWFFIRKFKSKDSEGSYFWLFVIGFCILNLVTMFMSGMEWLTSHFGAGLIAIAIFELFGIVSAKWAKKWNKPANRVLFTVIALFFLLPRPPIARLLPEWLSGKTTMFFMSAEQRPTQPGAAAGFPAFKGVELPTATIEALQKIKWEDRFRSFECPFLNMSELTPLFVQYGVQPCKGMPLWYDTGQSLFPREIAKIRDMIQNKKIGLLFLQALEYDANKTYKPLIQIARQHYRELGQFTAPGHEFPVSVFVAQ